MTYMSPLGPQFSRCAGKATRRHIGETLIAASGRGALNPSREAHGALPTCQGLGDLSPSPAGRLSGRSQMSNMNDAMGLRMRYGTGNGQFDTEYDPTSATLWGFMNPKGNPCF